MVIVGMILIYHPGMKIFSQGISIGDNNSTPDSKAMLDIQSPNKGLLIPRIDLQSSNITTGLGVNQVGLLVFNTNPNYSQGSGFYFWTGIQWQKISDETDLPVNYWDLSGSVLYPSDTTNNIGIGTKASGARIVIKSIDGLIKHPQFLFYDPSLLYIGAFGMDTGGNVAMGWNAMGNNTTGWNNVGIGIRPLWSNTTGFGNVALGEQSLRSNTTGFYNTSINNSLYYNTTGFENVGIGEACLNFNTSGNSNVAIGSSALYSNTTGYLNVAIGYGPLFLNTTGIDNISIGNYTLHSNTVGTDNIA